MSEQKRTKFPKLYWLVVVFEFFERGSYYGMMSVLSVYLTDVLRFPKEDVGLIKGTIQPLLYFLPIISGALADRFGYRRTLMIAFALMGGGYFLTSQATEYAAVFISLVVMGIGAGTFKPVISGTIARCTDKTNSTLGFGIFYWSINLGAFLFPLFLVPFLKNNVGWDWVIIASAIGTGVLLIPTFLFFKEPPLKEKVKEENRASLLQTLADAFEIIYSPFILLAHHARTSGVAKGAALLAVAGLLGYGSWAYVTPVTSTLTFTRTLAGPEGSPLVVALERNLCKAKPYELKAKTADTGRLTVYDPSRLAETAGELEQELAKVKWYGEVPFATVENWVAAASERTTLDVRIDSNLESAFELQVGQGGEGRHTLLLASANAYRITPEVVRAALRAQNPSLASLTDKELDDLVDRAAARPFLVLFIGVLLLGSLAVFRLSPAFAKAEQGTKLTYLLVTIGLLATLLWAAPGLSLFARIVSSVIGLTVLSLYAIDYREMARFYDHLRFLVMIFIYAGFWVLYFQMFDSVLWYVQAYVDAGTLNAWVNGFLGGVGLDLNWRFDVEHVTVINAGTIILLQLFISNLVKNTRALPTMIAGIAMGTAGMAILAISTNIWVFMAGTIIFSIGEMTAHPKFISYVGQTAPQSKVAMYMGYVFLYGVIGSSIGGVLGANLYVKFVDELNQPRTLWLIFTAIGVATVIGLLLFNRFLARKEPVGQT